MIFGVQAPPALRRAVLAACVLLLAGAAWLALWLADGGGTRFLLHQAHGHAGHGPSSPLFPLAFVGGWTVMTIAMMLPTSLPVLTTFHAVAGGRPGSSILLALAVAGYLASWTAFGVLVYIPVHLATGLAATVPWLKQHSSMAAPLLFFVAGAFQFSALKYRCLDKCRSPFSFVMQHWQGKGNRANAFRLGLESGIFCVGCCWALMLLMFAFSVGSLAWMALLAAVMAVEKNVSWGRRLSAPVGASLLLAGVALLVLR